MAKYADACNVYGGPDAPRKLEVLREHCAREGRDYDAIEKSAITSLDLDDDGGTGALLERLRALHDMGFQSVHGSVASVASLKPLERIGADVIDQIAGW